MLRWKWDNIYSGTQEPFLPLAIRVDGSNSVRRHTHEFIEIGCVENGTMRHVAFTQEGKPNRSVLKSGDVFHIAPGISHEYSDGRNLSLINIIFAPSLLVPERESLMELPGLQMLFSGRQEILHLSPDMREKFCGSARMLLRELYDAKPGFRISARAMLIGLLVQLGRTLREDSSETGKISEPVWNAMSFMKENSSRNITLDEIAASAKMGKSGFCLRFRNETGRTPWSFLHAQRLENAKFFLRTHPDETISEIAYRCGFADNGYFARFFRKETGMTPSIFRSVGDP